MDSDKAAARTLLRERLRATRPEQRALWSEQLRAHLEAANWWHGAHTVMLFAAMRFEPDLLPLLLDSRRQFVFPSLENDRIVPRLISSVEDLTLTALGFREPDAVKCPVAARIDAVLVPGLGFSPGGARLGRGRGHYDRFLAALPSRPVLCGVCFDCQVLPRLTTEPHDVKMDAVLTESGLILSSSATRYSAC